MLKPLALAIALALTASVNADTDCEVKLREGKLVRLETKTAAQREIIQDSGKLETKNIDPKEGKQYAVLSIKMSKGRSLGIYDYKLTNEDGEGDFNILGMSINDGPFQRTTWEVKVLGSNKIEWESDKSKESRKGKGIDDTLVEGSIVKLLFEVPSDSTRFKLASRIFDSKLEKEYGIKEVLDFEKMEKPKPKKKKKKKKKAPAKTE